MEISNSSDILEEDDIRRRRLKADVEDIEVSRLEEIKVIITEGVVTESKEIRY